MEGPVYIETKGLLRKPDARKLIAVKECNPEIDLRLVFYEDKRWSKRMRYTDWAAKHGFECAIGRVPKEWV